MSESLSERLERLMTERAISRKALSARAGLNETAVRDIMERNGNPTLKTLQKLATALGVDTSTLISDLTDLTEDEAELLRKFRALSATQKAIVAGVAENMVPESKREEDGGDRG